MQDMRRRRRYGTCCIAPTIRSLLLRDRRRTRRQNKMHDQLPNGVVSDASPYELFSRSTTAIFYNYKRQPIQRMLDFDFICGRSVPSVCAIVSQGAPPGGFQKGRFSVNRKRDPRLRLDLGGGKGPSLSRCLHQFCIIPLRVRQLRRGPAGADDSHHRYHCGRRSRAQHAPAHRRCKGARKVHHRPSDRGRGASRRFQDWRHGRYCG